MLEGYVKNYMVMLKDTFDNLDELNGESLYARVNTEYLDTKEVKTALVNEISKYYSMKKPEVSKLLIVEEMQNEG